MSDHNTIVFELKNDGFLGKATTSDHVFHVDEPVESGGTDLYPTPRNYLLGSLASCTAITMRMYANRKGWTTGGITVTVQLVESMEASGKAYKFTKLAKFENKSLTTEQVERLIKIGSKCPVNKIIESNVEMKLQAIE